MDVLLILVCKQPSEVVKLSAGEILNLRSTDKVLNLTSDVHQPHIRSESDLSEAHIRPRLGIVQAWKLYYLQLVPDISLM